MQYATWRSVLGLSLLVGALSPLVLPRRGAPMPLNTRAVGELHTASLTTMQVTTNAPIQDTRPRLLNRGTQLDGRLRLPPAERMAINADPFEDAWRAPSIGGIDLATGAYAVQDVDIALPSTGHVWSVGRSYNARQDNSGAHMDSNGGQGCNWFQASQPSIVLYDPGGTANDMVYLMYGADRFAEYKRVVNSGITGDTFAGVNGSAGVFLFTNGGSGPDTYELTDQNGNKLTFLGFDTDAGVAAGELWTIVDPAGNKAYVGHATSAASAITSGYDGSGRMTTAYDTSGRRYTYTYTQFDSVYRLTQVKAEVNSGSWAMVAQVDYGYYTSGQIYGNPGDLKTVTLTTPLSDSGVSLTQKKYYRYYFEGTYDATNNPGYPHALQYVVDFEGVRKYDWSDSTFDDDEFTASESSLRPYASAYFKYDTSYRIKEAWFNGECGCSGANNGTYLFEYEDASFSGTSGYDTAWCTRTIVQRPDTRYLTQYWDEVGQPLSQVITDADPDNTSPVPSRWVTRVERDSSGRVTKVATPANCTGYTHSTGAITASSSAGVIWEYSRETSGALTGFANAKKYRVGTSGTLYYDSEKGLEQRDLTIVAGGNPGAVDVTRPGISGMTRYPQVTTTSSATYKDTHTLSWDGTTKLWLTSDQVAEPAVTTGNNGSGTANSSTRYFRVDGTPSFQKERDGVINYKEYTNGQLTEEIEDADTDQTSDFDVSVGSLSSPDGYHRKTTYAYDAQGRLDLVTAPDGRTTKYYYTTDAARELVKLVYADYEATPKFYGPVSYTITNQAGNVEVEAMVALSGNESTTALTGQFDESDADPITAMDLGTVARLTTNMYNESGGTVQESRLYFLVPSSGAGTDGTNYDPTFFGYDDNGRRVRTKEPHGTITRTVHDKLGRVTGRWMGTNDHSFAGGEASGTDNMVQTEALEYDGNDDDGNGYLTKRTLYLESGTSGQRVTTYANDTFGRVLLQTSPTAPHAFHKYDNEGHNVATGLFSSTASIVVGTDDPTTETANRLALTESFYDEIGQMWKSVRHKIDAADGSDDDTLLHLYWRDAAGRLIKEDGPQLVKTVYDRIGREVNHHLLASDNDTAYADMTGVSGDFVMEQEETVYESSSSDDVWMRVRLDRTHTDNAGPGDTVGALDTGADGDRMLLTSSELKGRAQIRAFWYDRFGRVTDQVQYGTYGGATFDRDPLSVPSRSDTALVTSYAYHTDGELLTTTDPRGLVAWTERDQAGRTVKEIRNYSASVNSGNPANPDDNQTVKYEFVDGLRTKIIADMPSGEDDQETVYIYGTSSGTPSAMKVSTGHLLRAVKYPDSTNSGTTSAAIASDSSDVVSYAYNAQGQETYRKDQAGNVFETDYDDAGRQLHVRVATLASGFDGAVRRQSRTYDGLGRPSLVTQYDNATVGSGSVTDEVSYTYDGWGGITNYKQDKDSAVGGSGYYEVAYTYEKATDGRNSNRRTSMTLPGGKTITYDYGVLDSPSRVAKLKDGTTVLAKYAYIGASQVVGTTYLEPNVARTEYDPASNSYNNYLDIFNRVVNSEWWTLAPSPDKKFYNVDVSYDRNSNITWVEDNMHSGFDVKYTMDDLDRLIDAEEGTRSGSSIASRTRQQTWTTLDHVGNWDRAKLDLNGDTDFTDTDEYDDTRTHNKVNELTARDTDTNGTSNYTLSYDAAGSLTDDGESYKYEYDAFYRLRKVKNQSSTLLAEYRYNGLGHMIGVHEDTDADGDADSSDIWSYPAYDERWREVARYRESDSSPKEQFVNAMAGLDGYGGSSYINDVVCRNRDNTSGWLAASDGTLEERYYYCPNWRGDVSALVSSGRQLHEMDKYLPYGIPFGLPGGDTNSDGDNDSADATQIQTWIDASTYDVRGDVDLDGDVDSTDKTLAQGAPISGATLGGQNLSGASINRQQGFSGCRHTHHNTILIRHRTLSLDLGRWHQRDPLGYEDGADLLEYARSNPIALRDPDGTIALAPGGIGSVMSNWYKRFCHNECEGNPTQASQCVSVASGFHVSATTTSHLIHHHGYQTASWHMNKPMYGNVRAAVAAKEPMVSMRSWTASRVPSAGIHKTRTKSAMRLMGNAKRPIRRIPTSRTVCAPTMAPAEVSIAFILALAVGCSSHAGIEQRSSSPRTTREDKHTSPQESVTLHVSARSAAGSPIQLSARNVRIITEDGIIRQESAITDAELQYQLLPSASYWISAFAPGWKECVQRVTTSLEPSINVVLLMMPDRRTPTVLGVTAEGMTYGVGQLELKDPLRLALKIIDDNTSLPLASRASIVLRIDGIDIYQGEIESAFALDVAVRGNLIGQLSAAGYAPYGFCVCVEDNAKLDFGEVRMQQGNERPVQLVFPADKHLVDISLRYAPRAFYSECRTAWLKACDSVGRCSVVLASEDYILQGMAWNKGRLWLSPLTAIGKDSHSSIKLILEETIPVVFSPIDSDAPVQIDIWNESGLLFASKRTVLNVPKRMYVIPGNYTIRLVWEQLVVENELRLDASEWPVRIEPLCKGPARF